MVKCAGRKPAINGRIGAESKRPVALAEHSLQDEIESNIYVER
jgi:hypothetical protein